MTVADKIKILDDKIKSNQSQYDWGREAAKISALSSRDLLEKYKYLTGEDLGHKPSVIRKAKSEYYPLGMTMKKELKQLIMLVNLLIPILVQYMVVTIL